VYDRPRSGPSRNAAPTGLVYGLVSAAAGRAGE
jgi:hypothetical protein